MYNFDFFKYINILLEQQQKSLSFLNVNVTNDWQFFIQKFGSSFSISNLSTYDWWKFVFTHVQVFEFIFILLDLILYITFFVVLIQFGLLYSKNSSKNLLLVTAKHSRFFIFIVWVLLSLSLILSFVLNVDLFSNYSAFHGLFYVNYFTQFSKFFLLMIWLGLFRFVNSLSNYSQGISEFPLLAFLILCLSTTLLSAGDLGLFFICLEGFSLILYIMTTIGRSHGGITSAAKYFSFGTAGSILIVWGIVNVYSVISTLSFKVLFFSIDFINLSNSYFLLSNKLNWACSLILIGFLIKLGAAPLHQWVVDVYSGVPLFITAFFSILVKFVIFIVFLRLAYLFNTSLELEYAAIFSLIVGCFGTLRQVEIKRFLAYGSITHVGFLLSGDLSSSIMYLATYLVTSFVFFSVLLNVRLNNNKELVYLSDLKALSLSGTFLDKTLLTISLASMAGLPPFAGFYGKLFVWSSLIEDIYLFNDSLSFILLIVNLSVSLVVIFYYMRLVNYIFLGAESSEKECLTISEAQNSSIKMYNVTNLIAVKFNQYLLLLLLCFWTLAMPLFNTILVLFIENLISF